MNLSLGARPWIYLGLGPFLGLVCLILHTMIHSSLVDSGNYAAVSELFRGLFLFVLMAYIIGALPAFFTGLLMDLISKMLGNYFSNTVLRLIVAGLVGLLVTIGPLILFGQYTNVMSELSKTGPLTVTASSIYGAIAAVICEKFHIKLGSPIKIP